MKTINHCASCTAEGVLSFIGRRRISKTRQLTVKKALVNTVAAKKFDISQVRKAETVGELKKATMDRYEDGVNTAIRNFLKANYGGNQS